MAYSAVGQGEQRWVTRLGDLRVTRSRHRAAAHLPWHAHENPCLTFVLDGRMTEHFSGRVVDCPRGVLLIKPAGERHRTEFENPAGCLIVELPRAESAGDGRSAAVSRMAAIRAPEVLGLGLRLVRELRHPDAASPLIVDGLVRESLGLALRQGSERSTGPERPPWLGLVYDRIRSGFREPLTLGLLAGEVGVHPDHLSRRFRREYGVGIGELVRSLRIAWALDRIVESETPLAVIALAAGFADQSQLTRAFKDSIGETPGRIRADRVGFRQRVGKRQDDRRRPG